MPVDPRIPALLDKGTGVPATHTLPVDMARAQYEARITLMASPAEIASIREDIPPLSPAPGKQNSDRRFDQ
jgi:hypothetical protein